MAKREHVPPQEGLAREDKARAQLKKLFGD
jgi:hypothetical protein